MPLKPTGQLGVQYVTGAAWAWAVRPPGQSTANTNARANLLEKMDIRATAKCPETIPSGYQECQCGAAGRRITKGDGITEFCVTAPLVICPSGGLLTGVSSFISDFPKNISVPIYPETLLELSPSHPTRGAYHDRHETRGADAVDAAAFCARWMAGRVGERPVSDYKAS